MKKVLFVLALVLAANSQATNLFGDDNRDYSTTNAPKGGEGGHGGHGGQGGAGGDALSIAGASSAAEAKANAAAIAAQQQAQQQGQSQAAVAAQQQGISNSGNSGGNSIKGGDVTVAGSTYERSAPAVFAAPIPTTGKSCRLYMFGGGTTKDGAVSGSLPLGNDRTCLAGNNINNMKGVNEMYPDTFSKQDFLRETCSVEGMEDKDACKALK